MEPTLAPDKDCYGTLGGDAVVDDCGYCTGGRTIATFNEYLGCDSACQGNQIDCSENVAEKQKRIAMEIAEGLPFTIIFAKTQMKMVS